MLDDVVRRARASNADVPISRVNIEGPASKTKLAESLAPRLIRIFQSASSGLSSTARLDEIIRPKPGDFLSGHR